MAQDRDDISDGVQFAGFEEVVEDARTELESGDIESARNSEPKTTDSGPAVRVKSPEQAGGLSNDESGSNDAQPGEDCNTIAVDRSERPKTIQGASSTGGSERIGNETSSQGPGVLPVVLGFVVLSLAGAYFAGALTQRIQTNGKVEASRRTSHPSSASQLSERVSDQADSYKTTRLGNRTNKGFDEVKVPSTNLDGEPEATQSLSALYACVQEGNKLDLLGGAIELSRDTEPTYVAECMAARLDRYRAKWDKKCNAERYRRGDLAAAQEMFDAEVDDSLIEARNIASNWSAECIEDANASATTSIKGGGRVAECVRWGCMHLGLTREEVRGILGQPDYVYHSNVFNERWEYCPAGASTCDDPNAVGQVVFDDAGRLTRWEPSCC